MTSRLNRFLQERAPVTAWARLTSPAFLLISLLILTVMASGIAVVYSTHKNRYVFHELQQLRGEHNELEVQWGQLLIEQSTFGLESRIERMAADELSMRLPDLSQTVVVSYE